MLNAVVPLEISQLQCIYATHAVLNNISITLKQGEFLSILGTSGCGKTTLLRAIAGLVTPQQGTISIAGRIVVAGGREKISVNKRKVGFVFQDYALFPYQTVRQNITFGLPQNNQEQKNIAKQRVDELLTLINMQQYADALPGRLSGGQQQRVALARALAPQPRLLLLDEPFANVDTTHRQILAEQLQRLVQREQVSVILVTHVRNEALALADRVAILEQGENGTVLSQCDTPEQVYHCPANERVAQMTGLVSLFAAEAQGNVAHTAIGTIPLSREVFGEGWVVIRPEMALFVPDMGGQNEIISRSFHGRCYRLLCRTPGGELLVEWNGLNVLEFGQRGHIQFIQPCYFILNKTEKERESEIN